MSVSAVLNWFKPAPHLPEIQDAEDVKSKYNYWRLRTFYTIYVGYLFYYFTRKSFTFITPFLSSDLGLTKSDIGILASAFSIAYGISRFASGIMCDRSNPRYFMSIGLILTGFSNIFFGLFSSIWVFALFWGLNGWFQGWGWPACTKQLTHWYSQKERGSWYSICSTSHNVGGFLIAYLAAYTAAAMGWRWAMYVPGILCVVVGLWIMNRLRDVPQSLGLPPIEQFKDKNYVERTPATATPLPVKQILFEQILTNKYLWVLAASYFFVYIVRTAVNDWGTLYLAETKNYTPIQAAVCVSWFEIGGFFGILVAGWGSDYWFQGRRVPLMVISAACLILAVIGLWFLIPGNVFWASAVIALIGFLVFGPQMLVGLAAAEFVDKKATSTSNGFTGFFGYLGAAAAGYPLGIITEIFGWYGFVVTLVICSALIAVILIPIWAVRSGRKEKDRASGEDPGVVDSDFVAQSVGLQHSTAR